MTRDATQAQTKTTKAAAMRTVTFRADRATLDAIADLEAAVEAGVAGRRAAAIRRGLQDAARLRTQVKRAEAAVDAELARDQIKIVDPTRQRKEKR